MSKSQAIKTPIAAPNPNTFEGLLGPLALVRLAMSWWSHKFMLPPQLVSMETIHRRLLMEEVRGALRAAMIIGPLTSLVTTLLHPAHISRFENWLSGLIIGTILPTVYLSSNALAQDQLRKVHPPHFVVVATTLLLLLISTVGTMIPVGLIMFPDDVMTTWMLSFGLTTSSFFALMVSIFTTLYQFTGRAVVRNVYQGTYFKPRLENRVFLFVDIRSSSTLAEEIGADEFFKLVNEFHVYLETFARYYHGTIYKYLGDGQIIVWPADKATDALLMILNFAQEFRSVQARVKREHARDLIFTAGLHYGPCVISEIGFERKEIGYWGDSVNTTQRIQEACKRFDTSVLISDDLMQLIRTDARHAFQFEPLNDVGLRGKNTRVNLLKPLMCSLVFESLTGAQNGQPEGAEQSNLPPENSFERSMRLNGAAPSLNGTP